MAAIASVPPVNLTPAVLGELTSKLDKQPEIKELEVVSDTESVDGQIVTTDSSSAKIGFVHEHVSVRSTLHKDAVHIRQDLQLHLRSVMRTGDDMLVKIRYIIEELDTAVHARQLAETELVDVKEKRRIIKEQLEKSTLECTSLRVHLLEMSKARDRAEIALEVKIGHLLEKTEECNELKRESARLHIQITEISQKLYDYTVRLTEAEKKLRLQLVTIRDLNKELEDAKIAIISWEKQCVTLGKDLAETRMHNKQLEVSYQQLKVELISMSKKYSSVITQLEQLSIETEKYKKEKETAEEELKGVRKDCEDAQFGRKTAEDALKVAISARDQAIENERSTDAKWVRDSSLLVDCQRSLTVLRETVYSITKERDLFQERYEDMEHLRDEAHEQFRHADKLVHCLKADLVKANEFKLKAQEEVELAKKLVFEAERSRGYILAEKQQVEIVLARTESEKNNAVAAKLKMYEEYIEADRQRDEAIKDYEIMEDRFQVADKALAVASEKLDATQTSLSAASFKVEQLTAKLEKSEKSEAALTKQKTELTERVKAAETAVTTAKKELKTQVDKLSTENTKLQKDLQTTQASEKELIKSKTQLVDDKANLSKQLAAANTDVTNYKKKFDAPIEEQAGILIRHIFFGSVRITSKEVYQKVLDSYTHHDGCKFTVNSKFVDNADADNSSFFGHRWMAVYYAVRKNNVLVDRLPIWYKEGSKDNHFHPQ